MGSLMFPYCSHRGTGVNRPARASAYGCFGAIGRAGGIVAPWVAASLLETRFSLGGVFGLLAMAPVAAGAILMGVRRPK